MRVREKKKGSRWHTHSRRIRGGFVYKAVAQSREPTTGRAQEFGPRACNRHRSEAWRGPRGSGKENTKGESHRVGPFEGTDDFLLRRKEDPESRYSAPSLLPSPSLCAPSGKPTRLRRAREPLMQFKQQLPGERAGYCEMERMVSHTCLRSLWLLLSSPC